MEPLWPSHTKLRELLREPREPYAWIAPLAPSKAPLVLCVCSLLKGLQYGCNSMSSYLFNSHNRHYNITLPDTITCYLKWIYLILADGICDFCSTSDSQICKAAFKVCDICSVIDWLHQVGEIRSCRSCHLSGMNKIGQTIVTYINFIQPVSQHLEKLSSLQKWSVLDAVSH